MYLVSGGMVGSQLFITDQAPKPFSLSLLRSMKSESHMGTLNKKMQTKWRNIYYSLARIPRRYLPLSVVITVILYTIFSSKIIAWLRFQQYEAKSRAIVNPLSSEEDLNADQCPNVALHPIDLSMKPFLKDVPRFNCRKRELQPLIAKATFKGVAFQLERGHYLVRQISLAGKHCCYKQVTATDDETIKIEDECKTITSNVTKLPPEIEAFEVVCKDEAKNKIYYKDGFSAISPKPKVEERIKAFEEKSEKSANITEDEESLSVIVIALKSVSQMHFIRTLPKTTKYLTNVLSDDVVRLHRYNKIGEDTLPNILGSFTGRTFKEFQKECVKDNAGKFEPLSKCAFIWKIFAMNGYRTGFSEDQLNASLFNSYFGNAFEKGAPTDYYWRPYSILMENHHGTNDGFCYGAQLSFETLMRNIRHMAHVFRNKRYFKFAYSSRLGNENFNTMAWADKPLYSTIKHLKTHGYLKNTALVIIGDHGLLGHDNVPQAMHENRQPAAYIVLPEWFRKKYRQAYKNLRENAESSLTTPYDLYKTMLDFMDLGRLTGIAPFIPNPHFKEISDSMANRGISLFEEFFSKRSCLDAGIPLLWCTCYNIRTPASVASSSAMIAGEMIITKMNSQVADYPHCVPLGFNSIKSVNVLEIGDEFQKNKRRRKTSCPDPFECSNHKRPIIAHIVANAQPANVIVEAIVIKMPGGDFQVSEELVRIDQFHEKSLCVPRHLQPFCICQSFLEQGEIAK